MGASKLMKAKNIIQSVLSNVVMNPLIIAILYMITAVLWYFPTLGKAIDIPMDIMFIWGNIYIIYDLIFNRKMFSGYKSGWLVLFTFSYIITMFIHSDRYYLCIKQLIYNSILIFILYSTKAFNFRKSYKKPFIIANDALIGITFVASVVSIVLFALQFNYEYVRGDITIAIGVVWNRLHGVYTSANIGALLSIVSIALCLITYHLDKAHFKKFKVFYIINGIVQVLYHSATLSKGGFLAFAVFVSVTILVYGIPALLKKMKPVLAVALSVIIAGFSVVALNGVLLVSKYTMQALPGVTSLITTGEWTDLRLERVETDDDMTNGRTTIWKAGIALIKDDFVFGAGDGDAYMARGKYHAYIFDECKLSDENVKELIRADGYMHNAFVQILVCAGASGLLIFLIFAFLVGKKYLVSLFKLSKKEDYNLVGAIFILIMLLASQVFSESHLLFNRQDPFACIFWFYLGFGVFVINKAKAKENNKSLFICDTPYQVINSISLAKNEENPDIYIYNQFKSAESIAENLKKTDIFKNVILVDKYNSFNGVVNKFVTLIRIFLPLYTLKKYSRSRFKKTEYKRIYTSFFTSFTDSVKLVNPDAEIIQYEDGIGSYSTKDFQVTCRTTLFKIINELLIDNRLTYNVKEFYLNRPECYDFDIKSEIKKLEQLPFGEKTEKVFEYKGNDIYKNSRFVYLTQPLYQTVIGDEAVKTEKIILEKIKDDVILRVHPRQKMEEYEGYNIDDIGNLWEIECAKQISDNSVLIGAYSTAQFTPKMLCNKEPYVIFTYKIYKSELAGAAEMIEKLRKMYKNSDKVIVAESLEHLQNIIGEL